MSTATAAAVAAAAANEIFLKIRKYKKLRIFFLIINLRSRKFSASGVTFGLLTFIYKKITEIVLIILM